jgi:DNA repair protein RecN (Recombination protein N)
MLTSLNIKNIVLIESAEIDFSNGFTVLTGETGAGKSIILDSLSLCLGARANADLLRKGTLAGSAIACFDVSKNLEVKAILEENSIEFEDELIIRRTLTDDGKTKAYLNDAPISAGLLKQLSSHLVEIHGQNDQSGLLDNKNHLKILDEYAEIDRSALQKFYQIWKEKQRNLNDLIAQAEKARAEKEYLEHSLQELDKEKIYDGEEDELVQKRSILQSKEKLSNTLESTLNQIAGENDLMAQIGAAQRILSRNKASFDESIQNRFSSIEDVLEKAATEVSEAHNQLEKIRGDFEISDISIDDLEDRLYRIRELCRKYSRPSSELVAYAEEIRTALKLIESNDSSVKQLEAEIKTAEEAYLKEAKKLSEKRKSSGETLNKNVEKELSFLKMSGCRFKVMIEEKLVENYSADGIDSIKFYISTNPAAPLGDIAKIASGGELSRIMLALKVCLSDVKSAETIIFDEIDTGIGGAVAEAVGDRLATLGKKYQVFAITHQPQVASKGDTHFKIIKKLTKISAETVVTKLVQDERREEIARMISGSEITNEARAAAEKLMAG